MAKAVNWHPQGEAYPLDGDARERRADGLTSSRFDRHRHSVHSLGLLIGDVQRPALPR